VKVKQHRENLQIIPGGIGKTTATSILAESPDHSSFKAQDNMLLMPVLFLNTEHLALPLEVKLNYPN
jgi:hypothetical protein